MFQDAPPSSNVTVHVQMYSLPLMSIKDTPWLADQTLISISLFSQTQSYRIRILIANP